QREQGEQADRSHRGPGSREASGRSMAHNICKPACKDFPPKQRRLTGPTNFSIFVFVRLESTDGAHCFSSHEREALARVAGAAMPAGRTFPGGGAACSEKVDRFFQLSPQAIGRGYRAMLWALEASALLHHR